MGYVTLIVLILTIAALAFGALFGAMRGANRAGLRLALVVLSVVLAVVLRGAFVETVMNIQVGEETLRQSIVSDLQSGETEMPATIMNLVFVLMEILISFVLYFTLFIALRFITWAIFFPILKIFVKAGENRHAGLGALFGTIQGLVVAFAFCAPLTGLIVQVEKLSSVQVDGKPLVELGAEAGVDEYANSALGKTYNAVGGWYFEMLASTKGTNGQNYSLSDSCDIVVTFLGLADTVTHLSESMEIMGSETASAQQQIDAMYSVGDKLIRIDQSVEALSDDAKQLVNEVMKEVKNIIGADSDSDSEELDEVFENLQVEDMQLSAAGKAMQGIAVFIDKTSDETANTAPVTQNDVNDIVYGLADNFFIVELIAGGEEVEQIIELDEEHQDFFETAIQGTSLSPQDKNTMRKIFGLAE